MLVVPKTTWGSWWQVPKDMFHALQMQISKTLGVYKSPGSPDFLKLLRSHTVQVAAKADMDAVSNMHMVVHTQYCHRRRPDTWLSRVCEDNRSLQNDFCGFLDMTEGCRSFCRTHALCSGKLAFAVRKAYRQSCVHSRAVLTGAAVSDACFRAMKREVIDHHCVHCNTAVIPT